MIGGDDLPENVQVLGRRCHHLGENKVAGVACCSGMTRPDRGGWRVPGR